LTVAVVYPMLERHKTGRRIESSHDQMRNDTQKNTMDPGTEPKKATDEREKIGPRRKAEAELLSIPLLPSLIPHLHESASSRSTCSAPSSADADLHNDSTSNPIAALSCGSRPTCYRSRRGRRRRRKEEVEEERSSDVARRRRALI